MAEFWGLKKKKARPLLSWGINTKRRPAPKRKSPYERARYSNPLIKPIRKGSKPRKTPISFIQKPLKDKNMNWAQAKWKYPKLKAMGDKDSDGVKNMFDCKPLNRKKHMAFVRDDGGRKACGFKGKSGDCFTRAYAITEGKNYKEAYDELKKEFKKMKPLQTHYKRGKNKGKKKIHGDGTSHPRTGVWREHAEQLLKKKGYKWTPVMGIGTGTTKHIREGELPPGKNIVSASKHYIATEDQDWKDSYDSSRGGTRAVYGYYTKPEPKLVKLDLPKKPKLKIVKKPKPQPKPKQKEVIMAQDIIEDTEEEKEKSAQELIDETDK